MIFSKRLKVSKEVEKWCVDKSAKPDSLNCVTALNSLGYIKEKEQTMPEDKITWKDLEENNKINVWKVKSIKCPCRSTGEEPHHKNICDSTTLVCNYYLCPFVYWGDTYAK